MKKKSKHSLSNLSADSPGSHPEAPAQSILIRRPWWRSDWLFGLLLVIVTTFAYFPAWAGKPIWDDDLHHLNAGFRGLSGLARVWIEPGAVRQYYPVVATVFWMEERLWGDSPLAHHLVNILMHTVVALLLLRILRRLNVPGAPLAAALFALHPVQVETAAWNSELKNTLSGALCLGAALFYLKFDQNRRRAAYGFALGLFVLALLSKTVVATLPAALLVVFWWKRGRLSWKQDVLPLIPFFFLGAVFGILSASMERNIVGASGADYQFTAIERGLIAGRAIWFYLGKLVWPDPLIFIYPRWQISQASWWQYLFPVAALGLVVVLWSLREKWRAPLAAFLLFAGTLFPALGFVNVYPFRFSFVADHFQYLACIGPLTLAAAAMAMGFGRMKKTVTRMALLLCGVLLVTAFGAMTWRQSGMYKNMERLWSVTIARNPGAAMAHYNLGLLLLQQERTVEAVVRLTKAVSLEPENDLAHNNLGGALQRLGRKTEAAEYFRRASEIQPTVARYHANLGTALVEIGRDSEAATHYEAALNLSSSDASLANNFAWILATSRDPIVRDGPRAVILAQRAIDLSGVDNPVLEGTLAAAYAEAGRFDEAVASGEKAVSLANALNNRRVAEWNAMLLELYRARRPYHGE